MKSVAYTKGWVDRVASATPIRSKRDERTAPELPSRRTLREHGELYSAPQVAERLKVSLDTVYEWCDNGRLEYFKTGRHYRISEAQLMDFMSKRKGA